MIETMDIFYAAFLLKKIELHKVEKTSGHKVKYIFKAEDDLVLKSEYLASEYYSMKQEIEKLKILGKWNEKNS